MSFSKSQRVLAWHCQFQFTCVFLGGSSRLLTDMEASSDTGLIACSWVSHLVFLNLSFPYQYKMYLIILTLSTSHRIIVNFKYSK